jgi:hypothetical protein
MRYGSIILALSGLMPTVINGEEAVAIDTPPYTLEQGETRIYKRLGQDGHEVMATVTLKDKATLEISRSNGCTTTLSVADDRYPPHSTWKDCGRGDWSSGYISHVKRTGHLWPFKVGNKVSYHYRAHNNRGGNNERAFRKCEVSARETIMAGGKDYATFKIHCKEHNGTRTYWYAPELEGTVKFERMHKKRGASGYELVERMQ